MEFRQNLSASSEKRWQNNVLARRGTADELGLSGLFKVVDDPRERELPLRRSCGLGFVEKIEPLAEPILEVRQECFAVRLRMERFAPIATQCTEAAGFEDIEVACEAESTLRAHEESVADFFAPSEAQKRRGLRVLSILGVVVVTIAAHQVETALRRDTLQDRRFP